MMQPNTIGTHLKQWRARRGISQLDLAYTAGVSPRHLSFVETGKSKPSPELVLALALHLDVPLRERNTLLLAAGYAPRYEESSIDDPAMQAVRSALRRLLDAHDPFPGMVLDRRHDIVMTNHAADFFIGLLPDHLARPPVNMFRASLHPDGFSRFSPNAGPWAAVLLTQLERLAAHDNNVELAELRDEVLAYPNVVALSKQAQRRVLADDLGLVVSSSFTIGEHELSMFSTLTSFGSPRDITLDDASIELFFPANDATSDALHLLVNQTQASERVPNSSTD